MTPKFTYHTKADSPDQRVHRTFKGDTEFFRDKDILDIGCSHGYTSIELVKDLGARQVVGMDIKSDRIKFATGYSQSLIRNGKLEPERVNFIQCDGYVPHNHVGKNRFDYAIFMNNLSMEAYDMEEDVLSQIFKNISEVLRPDGQIIVATGTKQMFLGKEGDELIVTQKNTDDKSFSRLEKAALSINH